MSRNMAIERIRHLSALIKLQDLLDKHHYHYRDSKIIEDADYWIIENVSIKLQSLYEKWVIQDEQTSFEVRTSYFCAKYHEIFELGRNEYNPQDWNKILERTEYYMHHEYFKDIDLSELKDVVQKILASGHPEEYCVIYSW